MTTARPTSFTKDVHEIVTNSGLQATRAIEAARVFEEFREKAIWRGLLPPTLSPTLEDFWRQGYFELKETLYLVVGFAMRAVCESTPFDTEMYFERAKQKASGLLEGQSRPVNPISTERARMLQMVFDLQVKPVSKSLIPVGVKADQLALGAVLCVLRTVSPSDFERPLVLSASALVGASTLPLGTRETEAIGLVGGC